MSDQSEPGKGGYSTEAKKGEEQERIAKERAETKEEREKALLEYEILTNTEAKLLDWAKGRFWWVIVLGGICLGSSGYSLIQSMLSAANKAAVQAEIKAQLAGEATEKAEQRVSEVNNALANAREQTAKASEVAQQARSDLDKINVANSNAARLLEQIQQALDALEKRQGRLSDIEASFEKETSNSVEIIRVQLSSLQQGATNLLTAQAGLEAQVGGLKGNIAALVPTADPDDKSLGLLIATLNNTDVPSPAGISAATALGQRGRDASRALPALKAAMERQRKNETREFVSSPYDIAVLSAIAQIEGEQALPYLINVMQDVGMPYSARLGAEVSLRSIPGPWTTNGIALLSKAFDAPPPQSYFSTRDDILWPFGFGSPSFSDPDAMSAAKQLVIRGLTNTNPNDPSVQVAAFALTRTFPGSKDALPSLREALRRTTDENLKTALEQAIKAAERP